MNLCQQEIENPRRWFGFIDQISEILSDKKYNDQNPYLRVKEYICNGYLKFLDGGNNSNIETYFKPYLKIISDARLHKQLIDRKSDSQIRPSTRPQDIFQARPQTRKKQQKLQKRLSSGRKILRRSQAFDQD